MRWAPGVSARRQFASLGLVLLLAVELAAMFAGGSFVSRRFDRAASDIDARITHWNAAIALLATPADWLLGRGIGSFPAEYALASSAVESPGGFSIHDAGAGQNRFARVHGPTSMKALAGVFGISQRLDQVASGTYVATFEARAFRATQVVATICERHLIYEAVCASASQLLEPGDWRSVEMNLDGAGLGSLGHLPRPAFYAIAVNESGRSIDLRGLRLRGPTGQSLLVNGDFVAGGARWFLTGRYYFLPWHTDNLWLELLVERGVAGLAVWLALLAHALRACSRESRRSDAEAPWFSSALVAIAVTGCLGSVIDVPRVAFALQLLCGYCLLLFVGKPDGASGRRG
jgi:hypothetical protein